MALEDKDKYSVALLDLSLPDSSGIETLQKFLDVFPLCPTIVLTGYEDEKTGFEALHVGAVDYLNKGKINSYLLVKSILYACIRKDNAALIKAKEVAEKTAQLKQRFLASMSHELRTPLNVVIGTTNLMEQSEHTQLQQKYIDAMKIASNNLFRLVNNILDISKIESGKIELENHQFDLRKLLDDLMQLYSFKVREKKLGLFSKFDQLLPNIVVGDSTRLNQVLINLLDNAIKFTDAGGEVELKAKLVDETEDTAIIMLSVSDTGIGIKKDKLQKIFDSFSQADESTTRLYGGSGLGLSISQYLVSLFGGDLKVESEENKGATFSFSVTLQKAQDDAMLEGVGVNDAKEIELSDDAINILLVEDHEFNQMVASSLLKNWSSNINIDIANNGKEGVDKVKENDYDLVLMDIAMPVMDGHNATLMIRNELPAPKNAIPIIAMTAHAIKTEKDRCFEVGMNAFLTKPIDPPLLYEKIAQILNMPKEEMGVPKPANPVAENEEGGLKIDLTYLDELSAGDQDLKNTLIKTVIEDLPIELEKLKIAYADKEVEDYYRVAHKLKTTFAYVGLKDSPTVIDALERTEKNGKFDFEEYVFSKFLYIGIQVVHTLESLFDHLSE